MTPDAPAKTGKIALVTGGGGGIGRELARCFARDGYDLVLVARSKDAISAAAAELSDEFGITAIPIPCDLARLGAVDELMADLKARAVSVDVLVNNAGFGDRGAFADCRPDTQLGMIDVNVRALTELTLMLWPGMIAAGRGGVLNVSSLAAFQPGPNMAVYCASKTYVLSISEALWQEAQGTGVKVTCLAPGATRSGFQARARTEDMETPGGMMSARVVAEAGYRAFMQNRRVVIPGFINGMLAKIMPLVPRRLLLSAVASQLK